MVPLALSFGNGDVLLWMLEFFLFVIWFWILISIFSDLFRDRTTGGGVKALWVFFLIILPFLGILLYLIFRGRGMGERSVAQAAALQEQLNTQIRTAAGNPIRSGRNTPRSRASTPSIPRRAGPAPGY